ncbi:MAG: hypothetical protein Q8T09_19040 [Candidatus Melainabacteria bacterium]|nr:hypothetical protein [Candidatus Melainabacteria bacterium]
MFDYQAGEKYKMTLIMVGVAGAMAGIFFTLILSPTPVPTKHRQRSKADTHPDVTGIARPPSERYPQSSASQQGHLPPVDLVDNFKATALVEGFLPLAMDFNAATAASSQQSAMNLMTPDCAQSYITNIWTAEMATTIANSGMKSKWNQRMVSARPNQADGSIEIVVDGQQELLIPGEPPKLRPVKFVYLVKKASDGNLRIAGISEG